MTTTVNDILIRQVLPWYLEIPLAVLIWVLMLAIVIGFCYVLYKIWEEWRD